MLCGPCVGPVLLWAAAHLPVARSCSLPQHGMPPWGMAHELCHVRLFFLETEAKTKTETETQTATKVERGREGGRERERGRETEREGDR